MLLDPVLSELYDDLVNKAYIPTSQDCKAAKALMELLSEGFTDEVRDMQPKVKLWASQHMGNDILHCNGRILTFFRVEFRSRSREIRFQVADIIMPDNEYRDEEGERDWKCLQLYAK